jgi:transposase
MAQARLQLKPHLSRVALRHRYRKCKDAKEARRWHALWLMSGGASTQEAAAVVGFARSWVRRCATRYNQVGPEGVRDGHCQRPGGGRRRLTAKQEEQLGHALEREPPGGGLWSGPKVAAWIAEKTTKRTHPQLGWVYLQRLGLSGQVPRRQHHSAATAKERQAFKKS